MSEIQAIGSIETLPSFEVKEENLEQAIGKLSEYLLNSLTTGWSDDYGTYLVLEVILSDARDYETLTAFNHLQQKMKDFLEKRFFFMWDHVEFIELLDAVQESKPVIQSNQLKSKISDFLKTMLPEVDDACKGFMNDQSSLSLIFGKLSAIGYVLQNTSLSSDLQVKGKAIVYNSYPRFGNEVQDTLKKEICELLDLLEKC